MAIIYGREKNSICCVIDAQVWLGQTLMFIIHAGIIICHFAGLLITYRVSRLRTRGADEGGKIRYSSKWILLCGANQKRDITTM